MGTIKTAIQYTVLVNGAICLGEDGITPFRTYDFKKAKEFRVEMSHMYTLGKDITRIEVARITVIEGV